MRWLGSIGQQPLSASCVGGRQSWVDGGATRGAAEPSHTNLHGGCAVVAGEARLVLRQAVAARGGDEALSVEWWGGREVVGRMEARPGARQAPQGDSSRPRRRATQGRRSFVHNASTAQQRLSCLAVHHVDPAAGLLAADARLLLCGIQVQKGGALRQGEAAGSLGGHSRAAARRQGGRQAPPDARWKDRQCKAVQRCSTPPPPHLPHVLGDLLGHAHRARAGAVEDDAGVLLFRSVKRRRREGTGGRGGARSCEGRGSDDDERERRPGVQPAPKQPPAPPLPAPPKQALENTRLEVGPLVLHSVDEARGHHCPGALDVIIDWTVGRGGGRRVFCQ